MKKILLMGMFAIPSFGAFAQNSAVVSIGISKQNLGMSAVGTVTITGPVGLFGGINLCPSIGRTEKDTYPYPTLANNYKSIFAGAYLAIEKIRLGVGCEYNQTSVIGDTMVAFHKAPSQFCPRVYASGEIKGVEFMFTSNVTARLFDCWGYASTPLSEKVGIGVYANTNSIGYGPMLRFKLNKHMTGQPLAVALGYQRHQIGVAVTGICLWE